MTSVQHAFLTAKLQQKPLDDVLKDLAPNDWVKSKPSTAARVRLHLNYLNSCKNPENLKGRELLFSEDGFSWYKLKLMEYHMALPTAVRYESVRHGVQMVFKPVGECLVDLSVKYKGKKSGPELHGVSPISGEHLGQLTFQWGDRVCEVFSRAPSKLAWIKKNLSEAEQANITWMMEGKKIYPGRVTQNMFNWLQTRQVDVPKREDICKQKKGALEKTPPEKKRVSKTILK